MPSTHETTLEAVRVLGFRSRSGKDWPPLSHQKVALLGHLAWADEDALGHPSEHLYFRPVRLWRGSANFTEGSRVGLEEGSWSEEPALLQLFERYLLRLLAWSEPLDQAAEGITPELGPVVYDDEAFAELMASTRGSGSPTTPTSGSGGIGVRQL